MRLLVATLFTVNLTMCHSVQIALSATIHPQLKMTTQEVQNSTRNETSNASYAVETVDKVTTISARQ